VPIIADSLMQAREAHARLMREGGVMRAGLALQAAAGDMRMRPAAPRRVTAERRQAPAAMLRRPGRPACAAA
jgi:hypothetical protein